MTEPALPTRRVRRPGGERFPVEFALLGTLLLHAVLLGAFRMAPGNGPTPESTRGPVCILVSPLAESAPWEREIRAWCFFADPALLSLPNDEHGFGIVRREERAIPVSDVPAYQCKVDLRQGSVFPDLVLGGPPPSMDRQIVESWAMPPPSLPNVPPSAALPRGVLWYLTPEGDVLTAPPAIPPEELQKALAENPTLVGPTQIEIDRTETPTRLRLVQKCGSGALDQLALCALSRGLLKVEPEIGPARVQATGTGVPEKGQMWTLAVEWRLMPPQPAAAAAPVPPPAAGAAPAPAPPATGTAPQAAAPAQPAPAK